MLSPPVGTLASYTSVTNTETNLSTTASTATAAAVASQGNGYKLEDVSFQITRYDMVQSYFDAVASVLQSGAVFKLYYPNYSIFMGGQQSLPKGGTTRFNLSTQSLDSVISTFQVQDRRFSKLQF
jgi:hypothetical protein